MKRATLTMTLALLLSGCGSGPPDCTTPNALASLRTIVIQRLDLELSEQQANDPKELIKTILNGLTLTPKQLVTQESDTQSRRFYSCKGIFNLEAAGQREEVQLEYTVERIEEGHETDVYQIELLQADPVIARLAERATAFYQPRRYSGEWSGRYRCAGRKGAAAAADGRFDQPVTLRVNGTKARLERRPPGVEEVLEGSLDEGLLLQGTGRAADPATDGATGRGWTARFEGSVKGDRLQATGAHAAPGDGAVVRHCELDLTLQLPAASAAAASTATP